MKKTISILIVLAIVFGYIYINSNKTVQEQKVVDLRSEKIDNYFKERNMPLEGFGARMVQVADKNGLDWRLLPAIAIRESSGGKHMCKNNPFGWGSCKIVFNSLEEAIDTVGYKLNNLPVYKGKSTERKLYYYNGTVVPSYPQEVIDIMNKIAPN